MKFDVYFFCCCLMLAACGGHHDGDRTDRQKQHSDNWFTDGKWLQSWEVKADPSVDTAEFYARYSANPARWEMAFDYLATTDLENLESGRYELDGERLFAVVLEYETKDEMDVQYEAHKRYADIQYIVKGKEKISVVPLASVQEVEPYDEGKDIAFFSTQQHNYRPASPENFFVFFPDDAHRPGVKMPGNEHVKKIVIKVEL